MLKYLQTGIVASWAAVAVSHYIAFDDPHHHVALSYPSSIPSPPCTAAARAISAAAPDSPAGFPESHANTCEKKPRPAFGLSVALERAGQFPVICRADADPDNPTRPARPRGMVQRLTGPRFWNSPATPALGPRVAALPEMGGGLRDLAAPSTGWRGRALRHATASPTPGRRSSRLRRPARPSGHHSPDIPAGGRCHDPPVTTNNRP